jgi:hypothetical protein
MSVWAGHGAPQISTQELFLHREIDYFQAATLRRADFAS